MTFHCMDSPSTSTTEARLHVYHPTLSLDDIGISPSSTDEIPETDSFIYNSSFWSSETSIDSYKTEKTINSRKSRYNTFFRRKYDGIALSHGLGSLDVDGSKTFSEQRQRRSETRLGAVPVQVAVQNPILIDFETSTEILRPQTPVSGYAPN
jgi:hypothetical protein